MRTVGRIEAWLGLAAGAYGVAVTAIIAVVIHQTDAAPCGPPQGACVAGINPVTVFFVAASGLLYLLAAVGAALHGFRGSAVAAAALLLSVAALAWVTLLGMFSIGIFMLPGTLAMVGAAITAFIHLTEQRLTWPRWIEILAGAASGALGVVALIALFFLPSIEYNGPDFGGTFSIADFYGLARVLPAFLLVAAVAYVIAAAAMAHAAHGSRAAFILLALGVVALICLIILGMFVPDTTYYLHSVAQYLVPSAALAVIAVVVASTHLGGARPVVRRAAV